MTTLVPRSCAAAYDLDDEGRHVVIGQTVGGQRPDSFVGMVGEAAMAPRIYGIAHVGPDANRIVGMQELEAHCPERVSQMREEILKPNGLEAQLRVVFGDPHFIGYVGVYRLRSTRAFDARDVALFDSVLPELRRALEVWRAIGRAPLPRGLLGDVLDALDHAAYLLAGDVVVFANGVARARPLPTWLAAVARGDTTVDEQHSATVRRLDVEGRSFTLILAPRAITTRPVALPRWLARVADLAGEGLADKDIATRLAMPLATVRTAIRRIYTRTGVHSRAELVKLWCETRGALVR